MDVSTIRSRLAAALEAVSGWHESRYAPPGLLDAENRVHHSFAVAVSSSMVHTREGRRRSSELVETLVDVSWVHRLMGDAQVTTYGEALDAESDAIKALLGADDTPDDGGVKYLLDTMTRNADTGWFLGIIRIRVVHQMTVL